MTNEAKKLREEFEQKLKGLQENCKHPKWIWIPQPIPGKAVSVWCKICQRCDQIIEHKVTNKSPIIISSEDEWL